MEHVTPTSTSSTTCTQPEEEPMTTGNEASGNGSSQPVYFHHTRELLTLKLAGKSYFVSGVKFFIRCKYIRDNLSRNPAPFVDLPWDNEVSIKIMDWFVELLQAMTPGQPMDSSSLQHFMPEEDHIKRIAALARLCTLGKLIGDPGFVDVVRRTGIQLIQQVRVSQDTDTELRETVRQFDDAYQAWSSHDKFFRQWILAKFCNAVDDVDRAISLLGPLDISNEFREKTMGMQFRQKMRALSLQEGKAAEEEKDVVP